MIIESIHLKEGLFERQIEFGPSVTLIHSQENSCGKTTLLRLVLYGLGYNIPQTKKIKFNNCEVSLTVNSEKVGRLVLFRNDLVSIVMRTEAGERTFVLPEQQYDLHQLLFGTSNKDVLGNLLGAFYVDQEKGWTLLNRGVVIGSVHFSIEELIRGLSGRDCTNLINELAQLQREKEKYSQMSSVAQYREALQTDSGSVAVDSYEDETNAEISALLIQQRQLKSELSRIDKTLSDNRRFKQFVADMKLLVQSPDGGVFPVTQDNIVGFTDSIDFLVAKRKMVSANYETVSSHLERLEEETISEEEQLSFYESATQLEVFDQKILRIPINAQAVKKELTRVGKAIKAVQEEITRMTKLDNGIVHDISDNIIKYGTELGIGDKDSIPPNYLFTSNLKELSGALLHKTAFAFRLAYISVIEKVLGIRLPIILDSPSGKEVDQNNIALMMDILKRDFADHQIIIASIFEYDFENIRKVTIKGHLIDSIIEESEK